VVVISDKQWNPIKEDFAKIVMCGTWSGHPTPDEKGDFYTPTQEPMCYIIDSFNTIKQRINIDSQANMMSDLKSFIPGKFVDATTRLMRIVGTLIKRVEQLEAEMERLTQNNMTRP
jgi:hypothetical protein